MIIRIIEHKDAAAYIVSRGLLKQYQKAKAYILLWNLKQVDFKLREPKKKWWHQFRINDKYRAYCYFETSDTIVIFDISDHQKS